ncbi:MAG: hypothetical protein FWF05_06995 [Oscillospiraceae bacterium]|nr:hypothetical protein [Oscillospiraceae bacterium]
MSFADELRKKSDSVPMEEKDSDNRYMSDIYFSLKEGLIRCFLRKCYEEATRGEISFQFFVEFINIVGIIHEQERLYIKETDFVYLKHVMRTKKNDLHEYIVSELKKNGLKDIRVKVTASRVSGYCIKINVSW